MQVFSKKTSQAIRIQTAHTDCFCFLRRIPIPPIFLQIHNTVVADFHALLPQTADLLIFPAEHKCACHPTLAVYHAVAFDGFRVGILVQGIADHTRKARVARQERNIPVGRDTSLWDLSDNFIDFLKGIHRITDSILAQKIYNYKFSTPLPTRLISALVST